MNVDLIATTVRISGSYLSRTCRNTQPCKLPFKPHGEGQMGMVEKVIKREHAAYIHHAFCLSLHSTVLTAGRHLLLGPIYSDRTYMQTFLAS